MSSQFNWDALIVIATVGIMGAVLLANFSRPHRRTSGQNACINNLRQMDGAKEQWALENKMAVGGNPDTNAISFYIKGGHPQCPDGGTYTFNPIGQDPTCTISNHMLPAPLLEGWTNSVDGQGMENERVIENQDGSIQN